MHHLFVFFSTESALALNILSAFLKVFVIKYASISSSHVTQLLELVKKNGSSTSNTHSMNSVDAKILFFFTCTATVRITIRAICTISVHIEVVTAATIAKKAITYTKTLCFVRQLVMLGGAMVLI